MLDFNRRPTLSDQLTTPVDKGLHDSREQERKRD